MSQLPKPVPRDTVNKRILNELEARILNEQSSESVTSLRKSTKVSKHADMLFGCECDTRNCPKTISLSPEEYAQFHRKNMHFIVVPSHVHLDIEEIITSFADYCVVKKLFPHPDAA